MCVRVCPYFPFSTRICLNQHPWLTHQMKPAGIRFQQSGNAFRRCSDPEVLQKIADSLTSDDLSRCGHKGLQRWIPFFQAKERRAAGCWHPLFFSQVEYCDANRNIGRPDKLTVIFGRRITKPHPDKLHTGIEDLHLGTR